MILVLALVITVAMFIMRLLGGSWQGTTPQGPAPGRTALDILKERFVRGEIDKKEFEECRRAIVE